MSAEVISQLFTHKENAVAEVVDSIIRLTSEGEIDWDFSQFNDSENERLAKAEYKGIRFRSTHKKDEQAILDIETERVMVHRYIIRDGGALKLRRFVEDLVSKDRT